MVSRIIGRGVHAGELLGIPPSNKRVEADGMVIHRVRDGNIVEYWAVIDVARILQQVGVFPDRSEPTSAQQRHEAATSRSLLRP